MPTERIIHGERDASGHWSAWLTDTPQVAFGGCSSAEALSRVLGTLPAKAEWWNIAPKMDPPTIDEGRFDVMVRFEPCPDCGGNGRYVGLHDVEVCRTCGGRG